MVIVKIGGSLGKGDMLKRWLAALACGKGRAVVVPGGGAFADTVRQEQHRLRFSDRAAHRMGLLAMEQYALILADWSADLTLCSTLADMGDALRQGVIPVWLPSAMALADPEIPQSWEVTSDSLAAWLARRIGARRLILLKSMAAPCAIEPAALAIRGVVDSAFPRFLAGANLALDWVGPGDEERLLNLLTA